MSKKPNTMSMVRHVSCIIITLCALSTTIWAASLNDLKAAYQAAPSNITATAVIEQLRIEKSPELITFLKQAYADIKNIEYAIMACSELTVSAQYPELITYSDACFAETGDVRFVLSSALGRQEKDSPSKAIEYCLIQYNNKTSVTYRNATLEQYIATSMRSIQDARTRAFLIDACLNDNTTTSTTFQITLSELVVDSDEYLSVGKKYCAQHPKQFLAGTYSVRMMIQSLSDIEYTLDFANLCVARFNKIPWAKLGVTEGINICNQMLLVLPHTEVTSRLSMIIRDKRTILTEIAHITQP